MAWRVDPDRCGGRAVQLWKRHKKLLMTKQEVRDEHKDRGRAPEVKQRIRQLQREMSQRRMMAAIPEADVVITNPTHYAVALSTTRRRAARRCCWPRAATSWR
jgi:flagellar biosynthetic protein FlhB